MKPGGTSNLTELPSPESVGASGPAAPSSATSANRLLAVEVTSASTRSAGIEDVAGCVRRKPAGP